MKLQDIKHKIDSYFQQVTPEEIIVKFEKLGYEFETIQDNTPEPDYESVQDEYSIIVRELVKKSYTTQKFPQYDIAGELAFEKGLESDREQPHFSDLSNSWALAA